MKATNARNGMDMIIPTVFSISALGWNQPGQAKLYYAALRPAILRLRLNNS